jgi:hypothetical protein
VGGGGARWQGNLERGCGEMVREMAAGRDGGAHGCLL